MKTKKRQAGFGLLELMLSMVIVALLLIMATRYYQSARSNARVNQAVSLVATMVSAANNIALGSGGYANVTAAGLYPYMPVSAQKGDSNTIVSPWQGAVTTASPTDKSFQINFAGLPQNDCHKLADALGGDKDKVDTTLTVNTEGCAGGNLAITVNYINSNK